MFTDSTPPPPRKSAKFLALIVVALVALGLLSAAPALAQTQLENENIMLQLEAAGSDCLWINYLHPTTTFNSIYILPSGTNNYLIQTEAQIAQAEEEDLLKFFDGQVFSNSQTLSMSPNTDYTVYVSANVPGVGTSMESQLTFRTGAADAFPCDYVPPPPAPKSKATPTPIPTPRPPANTCPNLLPDIIVSGYVSYASQCQVVQGAGVGRQDLLDRGVIAAVDIWSLVPHTGVEVCFRNLGAAVVFLDAAYSPRLLSTLDYTLRDGMTCAAISTTGTVVLLAS